jgi:hypothetical protein
MIWVETEKNTSNLCKTVSSFGERLRMESTTRRLFLSKKMVHLNNSKKGWV